MNFRLQNYDKPAYPTNNWDRMTSFVTNVQVRIFNTYIYIRRKESLFGPQKNIDLYAILFLQTLFVSKNRKE